MSMKKLFYISFTIILLVNSSCLLINKSCVVVRPDALMVSESDYNQRKTVSYAHYDRVLNKTGVASVAVGTATGATLGALSNMFTYYNGQEKKTLRIAGAALGGTIGFFTSSYINQIAGFGLSEKSYNPQIWIDEVNKDFIIIDDSDPQKFRVIHKSAEDNFQIKNMQDVWDFSIAFPNSEKNNDIIILANKIVKRDEIPKLISIYSKDVDYPAIKDVKFNYLKQSNTTALCMEAKNKYPILDKEAEKKSWTLINNINDLKTFKRNYPQSEYMNDALTKTISSTHVNNLPQIIDMFPSSEYPNLTAIADAQAEYIEAYSNSLSAYLSAIDRYPKRYSRSTVENKSAQLVRNYNDARMFKNRFGTNSKYAKTVFTNSLIKIKRENIPNLLNLNYNVDRLTKQKAHNKYAMLSKSIPECILSVVRYSDCFDAADDRAYQLTNDIGNSKYYVKFFSDGKYKREVDNKIAQWVKSDYNKCKSLLDYHNFYNKYKGDTLIYDPEWLISAAKRKVSFANLDAIARYSGVVDIANGDGNYDRLVIVHYQTEEDYPAFLFLEKVKEGIQINDFFNPWITGIYEVGASGNDGLIAAQWYKSGTSQSALENLGELLSGGNTGSDLNDFQVEAGNHVKSITNHHVNKFYAYYYGTYEDDYTTTSYDYSDNTTGSALSERVRNCIEEKNKDWHLTEIDGTIEYYGDGDGFFDDGEHMIYYKTEADFWGDKGWYIEQLGPDSGPYASKYEVIKEYCE